MTLPDWWPVLLIPIVVGSIIGASVLIPSKGSTPCGEGIHVTHNGTPLANIAVKQLGSGTYTWGATDSKGYLFLSFCQPVGTVITYQATDYGFQLEPNQVVEAQI